MVNKAIFVFLTGLFLLSSYDPAQASRKVNWGAINPALKGAVSVAKSANPDDETECLLCHKDYVRAFGRTKHAKAFVSKYGKRLGSACETCHGPMSKHLGGDTREQRKAAVVSFKSISPAKKNAICLQCHEKGPVMHWRGSSHEMSDVSCDTCHYVMKKRSKRRLFINDDSKKACFGCHRGKRAKIQRTSHMPLREGKIRCASCHNPHGSSGPSLLKRATINETCYQCHREKRGPMLFEHAPVRENCANCHDPHGSNFKQLLKRKAPYLCQQCHLGVFHVSDVYGGKALANRSRVIAGKGCVNCHSQIHGSNHPAGARFQR